MSFFTVEKIFSFFGYTLSLSFLLLIVSDLNSLSLWGVFLIVLSFIGFSRFLWLITAKSRASKTRLPDQILSSLDTEADKNKTNIFKRSMSLDYGLFALLIIVGALWGVYCSFYPNEIASVKTVHVEFSEFFNNIYNDHNFNIAIRNNNLLSYFAVLFSVLILSWLQFSLSVSKKFIRNNLVIFLPAFLVGVVILNFVFGRVLLFQWPDTLFLSGAGLGIAKPIMLLHPDLAQDSMSFFMVRFFELGFLGAYGAYVFLLIPLSVFFHIITIRQRRKTLAYIGMITVSIIIMVDMFWLYHPHGLGVIAMGWFVTVVCWGQSGFKTPYILR